MPLIHRTSHIAHRTSKAFTLIELLIVIGIILILIGILIPTIGKVRIAVQTVATRQMISRLENGINAYFSDFGAYPGPFANSQLKPMTGGPPTSIGAGALAQAPVTSTENLYLGLFGGLTISPIGGPVTAFTFSASPSGPGSLNSSNPKRYAQYIDVGTNETTAQPGSNVLQPNNAAGLWFKDTGGTQADTTIPEVLDKYSTPAPILYLRSNRGAAGFVNGLTAYSGDIQYQLAGILNTYVGIRNPQSVPWSIAPSDYPANGNDGGVAGSYQYLGNQSYTTVATPLNKDGYLLISAGPDGMYGTKDDITNFRQ